MPETRRSHDREFRAGAVRIVLETNKPIAQVARDLGMHAGTLGNWIQAERRRRARQQRIDYHRRNHQHNNPHNPP